MSRLGNRVAAAVARSGLGEDCIITFAGVPFAFRATWVHVQDDEDFMSEEHAVEDRLMRVPVASLIRAPAFKDRVTVDGATYTVAKCRQRNSVYLVALTTWTGSAS